MPSVSSFFLFFPSQSLFLHNTGNFMGISSVSWCTLNSKGTWMLARCSIHCVATPLLPPPSSPPRSSGSHCLKLYTDRSSEKMYRWLASICKEPEHWWLFSSVQLLSRIRLFTTPWTTAHQASLSITNCQSPPKPMSVVSVMPSNHLILCHPLLLLPPIPPSIRVFSNGVKTNK